MDFSPSPAQPARLLLVDDQPENIQNLAHLLPDQYHIQVAIQGAKALEIAGGDNPPDLILLDIEMPEMNGYDVCRRLKANPKTQDIPIIFVTARTSAQDEEFGLNLGAVDYISKPYHPTIVRARVQNQIQRKKMEEALQESEKRYRRISENSPGGLFQLKMSPSGVFSFSYVSKRAAEITKIPGEAFYQDCAFLQDRIHPHHRSWMTVALQESAETLQDFKAVFLFRFEEENRWLEIRSTPEKLADGSVLWNGILMDIHAQKTAEEGLKREKERLNHILAGTDAGTWEYELQTGKIIVNQRWAQIIGYELEEITPLTLEGWLSYVKPKDQERMKESLKQHIQKKTDFYDLEIRMKHKRGHWVWTHGKGKVISWSQDGKPLWMFGTQMDITHRKQVEADLEFQLQFETMVSDISSFFISLPADQMEEGIQHAIQILGQFFQVDRTYVFEFSHQGQRLSNTYEWCREGISSQKDSIQNEPVDRFPWWVQEIRTQEYVWIPDVDALPSPARLEKEIFQSQQIQSLLCVPILVDGELFGFLGFDSVVKKKVFNREQIVLLKMVAELMANAFSRYLANEKITTYTLDLELQSMELEHVNLLLDEEIDKARRVHENTLPIVRPHFKRLELFDYHQPASRMGGDFYDFILLKENVLLFYLSDITGHGMDAAMMSAFLKNTISTYVKLVPEDGFHIQNLLDFVYQHYSRENYPDDYFITLLLGQMDLQTYNLTYCSAGIHISPVLFSPQGIEELPAGGMPISKAISPQQFHYQQYEYKIPLHSILFFSTDGFLEQGDGKSVYGERFHQVIQEKHFLPLPVLGEELNRDFYSFTGDGKGDDDITYLMMRTTPEEDLLQLQLVISSRLEEVEGARERVREFIHPYVQDQDLVMIAFHELLINAMEHGNQFNPEKEVQVQIALREKYLLISVKDEGPGFDWRKWATWDGEEIDDAKEIQEDRGLGFLLTKAASDYFYYYYNGLGNQATFVVLR